MRQIRKQKDTANVLFINLNSVSLIGTCICNTCIHTHVTPCLVAFIFQQGETEGWWLSDECTVCSQNAWDLKSDFFRNQCMVTETLGDLI